MFLRTFRASHQKTSGRVHLPCYCSTVIDTYLHQSVAEQLVRLTVATTHTFSLNRSLEVTVFGNNYLPLRTIHISFFFCRTVESLLTVLLILHCSSQRKGELSLRILTLRTKGSERFRSPYRVTSEVFFLPPLSRVLHIAPSTPCWIAPWNSTVFSAHLYWTGWKPKKGVCNISGCQIGERNLQGVLGIP